MAGTEIPTTSVGGGHFDISTAVMYPFISSSQRKIPSVIDILGSAEVSEFNNLNLNLQEIPTDSQSVPEPASILSLLAVGAIGAGSILKRKN